MAVITRYVVVRNGVEIEPVFTDRKEAEAYDRMLDAAEALAGFIRSSDLEIPLEDPVIEAVAVLLAKKAPQVVKILKGIKPVPPPRNLAAAPDDATESPAGGERKAARRGIPRRGSRERE